MSQWMVTGLLEAGLPVVCVETRHMKAVLKAQQVNKSDRNDARDSADDAGRVVQGSARKDIGQSARADAADSHESCSATSCRTWRTSSEGPCAISGSGWEWSVRVTSKPGVRELVVGHPTLGNCRPLACGTEGVAGAIRGTPQDGPRPGPQRPAMPPLDDGAGSGTGSGSDVSGHSRSAAAFCSFQDGGGAFRLGTTPLSVRRDGLRRKDLEMRGRHDAHGTL